MLANPRLRSLDAFRGAAVAAMILVNHQGNWGAVYAPLSHAVWNGWTPADLIFPAFIIAVGLSAELSLRARLAAGQSRAELIRQVLRRGAVIFLLGLFLNWFPGFDPSDLMGDDPSTLSEAIDDKLTALRILGVLQRIGLVYAMGGVLAIIAGWRVQAACLAVILVTYGLALNWLGQDFPGAVDRALLDWGDDAGNHIWGNSATYDPEGVVSTISALGTMIIGLLAGLWLRAEPNLHRRAGWLAAGGVLLAAAGLGLDPWLPINKALWTSTYVLFSGGVCLVILALFIWWGDIRGRRAGLGPFLVFGVNPLIAYFGSELMATILSTGGFSDAVYALTLDSWLPPKAASLAFALCYVAGWYLILRMLHRRGIILRIS